MINTGQAHFPSRKVPSGTQPRARAMIAPITVRKNDR